ncbi:MAG: efflux RND transporter periplasmic adaptor subunit [Anaerolineae bacterium]|uniref:efflux RND transporter periplasmic adaptor subunit n=1 Tax=Candidatus Amarolinea dominans TaxID=3140696 RepID=UPI003135E583|nr:efflux RND transporter periplasmic adaptor subunit [Anaerolineae bacterium]
MKTNTRTRRGLQGNWLLAGVGMVVLVIAAALWLNQGAAPAKAAGVATVAVTRGDVSATVYGSGTIEAEQALDVGFQTGGSVVEVLVSEGDVVTVGQALARLDTRQLEIQVTNAEAGLISAQARLTQARQGNARPQEISAAQAQVASAQANYDKLLAGPTAAELTAAQANIKSTQASYNAAVKSAGAANTKLESVRVAQEKAAAVLQQAQAKYDVVAWRADVGRLPEAVELQKATLDYEQATANYEAQLATTDSDAASQIATAAYQLAQAKSNLAKLYARPEDLRSTQASLDQAKANLDKLSAPATATDLLIQQAALTQAEQNLKQAQLNLGNATLAAPFDAVVTAAHIVPGSFVNTGLGVVSLVAQSEQHVDLKLSENDVVEVQLGQAVAVTIDSLAGWQGDGRVAYIAPAGQSSNGVVTYAVRVDFSNADARVKVGMTANVSIITERQQGVLLVPSTALLPKGAGRVVQAPSADGKTVTEIDVRTGLSDGAYTEIVSGLAEGTQIVALPAGAGSTRSGGLFSR